MRDTIKKVLLPVIIVMVACLLSGCGASDEQKEEMFDILKAEGYIDVGDRTFADYDEKRTVSQSPIPVNYVYYDYCMDDVVYTLRYAAHHTEDDTKAFEVHVDTVREDERSFSLYVFEESKWLWIRKLKLIEVKA